MESKANVTIDGVEYLLAWDFDRLADAEVITGLNLLRAVGNMGGGLSMGELRGLLFAMISGERPEFKNVGALIRINTIPPILRAIGAACAIAAGMEPEAAKPATKKLPKPRTRRA